MWMRPTFSAPSRSAVPKAFQALAVGGWITVPLGPAFWGGQFGMLTDAFGVQWMVNCP